ncbi:MAG: dynamin family protein [Microcystaceae cyanobacterium]
MTNLHPQCANLALQVTSLLNLINQESSLRSQDIIPVEISLKKAISPRFEVVFSGAFSGGKSMLINALLERELLYSAEGHATGTECQIEYAEPDQEQVVLTFLSESEIREQVNLLCQGLEINLQDNIKETDVCDSLLQLAQKIINQEGGESKSEKAKQAKALLLLIEGFQQNKERIHTVHNSTYSMEQFNFNNLAEAASYARRGSNSSVLKRIEYHCHHPLLKDGNVFVDMPGIDAPVKKDADLAYEKIEHPDTSAVVCVLKSAAAGDMTTEETDLLEKIRANTSIRDRVFYVFNRIDQTWYNTQLRQRLDSLIQSQFQESLRVYKTSGLLGFYGSQIKYYTNGSNRFGLDSILAESVKHIGGEEETPQFVSEFNNYCANSGKLTRTNFKVSVNGYETPNENYVRILSEWGTPLIDQLIADSGIKEFRKAITRYLIEEKRPQLFANLADDIQPICISLRKYYINTYRELDSQPREIEAMKAQELTRLSQELQEIGLGFKQFMAEQLNAIVINDDLAYEEDFQKLKARMVTRLDELLRTFSVKNAYSRATQNHPRNQTAPLIAVLVEALYYLANDLEDVLVEEIKQLLNGVFWRLVDRVRKSEQYRKLYRLLGNDGGIETQLRQAKEYITHALISAAKVECDRYVRESARFYDEGTFSIYQFRQTLQQTAQGYDCETMVEAEPAIHQLLKLDFEPKVSATVRQNFPQTIKETLKTQLLEMAECQAELILEQYQQARDHLEKNLEQEAQEKIARNQQLQADLQGKIEAYNLAVSGINSCLESMQVYERLLPEISDEELRVKDEVISPIEKDNNSSNLSVGEVK